MHPHGAEHVLAGDAGRFCGRAVHHHCQTFACQQQGQQRREHGQLACAVVAGQHYDWAGGVDGLQACVRGV